MMYWKIKEPSGCSRPLRAHKPGKGAGMDHICIRRLEVYASCGCLEEEQRLGQKFYITCTLYFDVHAPAENDDLQLSINYASVCEDISRWMQEESCRLIETAADRLCRRLLRKYRLLQKVEIRLEKPQAPVPYPFETIYVQSSRSRHQVFLSAGSNIGDRRETIERGMGFLQQNPDIRVERCSGLYETAPYGYLDQPPFLNCCMEISTILSPRELLDALHQVENIMGRKREVHWGPRTLDLDIIFYDSETIDEQDLHIPHIDMANRLFVLVPLCEIAGYLRHPYLNKTVEQLLRDLQDAQKENRHGTEKLT